MSNLLAFSLYSILLGTGATVVMDIWTGFLKRFFDIPPLNYALLGRWIGHLTKGKFKHQRIAKSPEIKGEKIIGWIAHYVIGIFFAALLLLICGLGWLARPTLLPPLLLGIVTIIMPFFIMQPGMGAGIASSKSGRPNMARFRSLMNHTVFGFGLYFSARFIALFQ